MEIRITSFSCLDRCLCCCDANANAMLRLRMLMFEYLKVRGLGYALRCDEWLMSSFPARRSRLPGIKHMLFICRSDVILMILSTGLWSTGGRTTTFKLSFHITSFIQLFNYLVISPPIPSHPTHPNPLPSCLLIIQLPCSSYAARRQQHPETQ